MSKAPRRAPTAPTAPEHPAGDEQWGDGAHGDNGAAEEAAAGDDADEASDGEFEAGDAPDEDAAADWAARSTVDHESGQTIIGQNEAGDGLATAGPALSVRQVAGIDAVDAEANAKEATRRARLTNAQTAHEAENALDAVSGTSNPGVTKDVSHSAPGKLGQSDMSGRKPFADPIRGASAAENHAMSLLEKASKKATNDEKKGHGYVTLRDLGVNKSVMDGLVAKGAVTQETAPGGAFNPDTGTVYRVASHVEPE